jgi:hypothetical protein
VIPVRLELKKKGLRGTELRQAFKRVMSAGFQEMGDHFHATNLPRRFTYAGGKMLDYAPRKPKYTNRKKRQKGHVDPLVWSGTSKKLATGIRDVRVKSTDKETSVKVFFGRARALNFKNKYSSIDMRDEVTRIADREHGPLTRVLQKSIDQNLQKELEK